MAFTYPTPFGKRRVSGCWPGERVEELAGELEVSVATLDRWKHQALIDAGRKPGVKSYRARRAGPGPSAHQGPGVRARLVKAASALFNGEVVVRPKGSAQSFED